ncbi:MAG: threonylcarbamoyl-AMP synthase [Candidatus Omnitrophica bacterium]|nr:threonylcarbamoyl-AMP synthase [Candidatus Omnitrophota bacterium]
MPDKKILDAGDPANLELASEKIRTGGVVAFPTETVYGLGADVFNKEAVCRVYEIKKRPSFDPLIVHVSSSDEALRLWREIPSVALTLMKKFWPGPLTLVLPKKHAVPDIVTAGLDTVAVRMPKHPAALELIRKSGTPVAAPSANRFGHASPTTAEAVYEELGEGPDLILDGGSTPVGVESTVLKVEKKSGFLLRPGGIALEELENFLRVRTVSDGGDVSRSPGRMESHYAIATPLHLAAQPLGRCLEALEGFCESRPAVGRPKLGLLSFGDPESPAGLFQAVEALSAKKDLREAAAKLFQAMRKLDKMGLDLILAMPVPEKGLGLAIMDRLRKASGVDSLMEFLNGWK